MQHEHGFAPAGVVNGVCAECGIRSHHRVGSRTSSLRQPVLVDSVMTSRTTPKLLADSKNYIASLVIHSLGSNNARQHRVQQGVTLGVSGKHALGNSLPDQVLKNDLRIRPGSHLKQAICASQRNPKKAASKSIAALNEQHGQHCS